MEIYCSLASLSELAHAVHETLELYKPRKYTVRPWSQYEPERSDWLLLPSSDWPPYRFGTGLLRPDEQDPTRVLCGLYLEKGYGPTAAAAMPELVKKKLVMDEAWTWHTARRALAEGRFDPVVERIAGASPAPLRVELRAGYVNTQGNLDPHDRRGETPGECRSPLDRGRIRLERQDGALCAVETHCLSDVTRPLAESRSLRELGQQLERVPEQEQAWVWIDLYIGVEVRVGRRPASGVLWNSGKICERLIRPWLDWVR